jgi:hypothetical protein
MRILKFSLPLLFDPMGVPEDSLMYEGVYAQA